MPLSSTDFLPEQEIDRIGRAPGVAVLLCCARMPVRRDRRQAAQRRDAQVTADERRALNDSKGDKL